MKPLETLLFVILILLSAYLSASEIALFSLSKFQLRFLKDSVRPATYRKIRRLLQDPGGLLVTILVVNELLNVSISSLITKAVALHPDRPSGASWLRDLGLGTLITLPVILFVCEITPKVAGARANQLVSTLTAGPLSLIYDLLKPIRIVLSGMVSAVSRLTEGGSRRGDEDARESRRGAILKESEFLMMVEEGHKQGAIHRSELDLIRNVFELDDNRIESVYTPLSQVHTLNEQTTIKGAIAALKSRRFSRIPVVSANRRQIVGILYFKDLLRTKLNPQMSGLTISDLMRKPLIVSSTMQLNGLFRKFKQHKTHMAVVQKATGETLGIVTMNDVLESLFDDLLEETGK